MAKTEENKPAPKQEKPKENIRHLVRVHNTDLDGSKPLYYALTKIKGVGKMYANLTCRMAGVDKLTVTGTLKEEDVKKLEAVLKDSSKVPSWMKNRRKDYETGEDGHLLMGDLDFAKENDIKRLKKIRSYRGTRHMHGLPSRGQRTKSNFRRNKGKVTGVKKRAGAKSGRS